MPAVAVAPTELDRVYGERALDDVIVRAWEELTAHRGVACPVCPAGCCAVVLWAPVLGAMAKPVKITAVALIPATDCLALNKQNLTTTLPDRNSKS